MSAHVDIAAAVRKAAAIFENEIRIDLRRARRGLPGEYVDQDLDITVTVGDDLDFELRSFDRRLHRRLAGQLRAAKRARLSRHLTRARKIGGAA